MPEASAEEPEEEAGPELTPPDPVTLPLTENGESFSFWVDGAAPFVTMYLGSGESYNTAACTEYLESVTGVHIEYREVSMFSAAEEFSLMVASQDYTDMISNFENLYSGGYAQGLKDEVVLPVNDLVETEMPYYKYYLDTHPEDLDATNDFNAYAVTLDRLCSEYTERFGPLENFGNSTHDAGSWVYQKWPWQN